MLFPFPRVSIPYNFLVRGGTLCPCYPSQCWNFIWLGLMQVLCMLKKCLCEYISASVLLCWEDTLSLELFTTSRSNKLFPLFCIDPGPLRRGVWWRHPIWGWMLQSVSLSTHCPVVGLCINSYLQPYKVPLMRFDKGSRSMDLIYGSRGISLASFIIIFLLHNNSKFSPIHS